MFQFRRSLIAGFLLAAAGGASAQLLPSSPLGGGGVIGSVTGPAGNVINDVGQLGSRIVEPASPSPRDIQRAVKPSLSRLSAGRVIAEAAPQSLLDLRKMRLAALVKESRGGLEMDSGGNPVVRGRLVMIDPPAPVLAAAARAGIRIVADERDDQLGLRSVTLAVPARMKTEFALNLLQRAAPGTVIDFDHIFEPAGGELAASSAVLAASTAASASNDIRIGMIDGGVARSPALASASIEQRGFAGSAQATGHGTAVASLIVGSEGKFAGAARGASLFVGDVYGGNPGAGSASSIVQAMSWLASKRPRVINVSLVGPRNRLVERAVAILLARGIRIVAAVGNDGPAAPPQYPASHAGVIAVTGVDARNRALPEAGRASHLDYAAPGADMAAALPGKGYATVRGTSFAAPFVASRLALTGSTARLDAEAARGRGRVGKGVVCAACEVAPKLVGAK